MNKIIRGLIYIVFYFFIKVTSILSILSFKLQRKKDNVLHPDIVDFKTGDIGKYIDYSIPVIVENIDKDILEKFKNKTIRNSDNFTEGNIVIERIGIMETQFSQLGRWIFSKCKKPIVMSSIFTGKYKSGITHIDAMSSYNFYTMFEGQKEVIIIPHGFESYVKLQNGIHNVHVSEEKPDTHLIKDLTWLKKIPYYYHFRLNPDQMLIFNNSACLHKFINKTENTKALTVRVLDITGANSLDVLKNQLFNNDIVKVAVSFNDNNGDNNPSNRY